MGSWSLRLVFLGMSVVAATAFAAQVDMPVPAPTSDHDTEATTNTVFFAGLSSDLVRRQLEPDARDRAGTLRSRGDCVLTGVRLGTGGDCPMREAFQILLEKLCCFGIGGIAVFLFVRATYDKWKNEELRM